MKAMAVATSILAMVAIGDVRAAAVGGVIWDPASGTDFSVAGSVVQSLGTDVVGGGMNGYGIVTGLNGAGASVFCPGCELTYVYSGFAIMNIDPATGALSWGGGTIDFYVDKTPNFDAYNQSTAIDGTLWLRLSGAYQQDVASGRVGTLLSDGTPAAEGGKQGAWGFFDVTLGAAADYFDTDSIDYFTPSDVFGKADFRLDLALTRALRFVSDDGLTYGMYGTSAFKGKTRGEPEPIPEPATWLLILSVLPAMSGSQRRP